MILNRFGEIKRFLSIYKVEEHIFHLACNNFNHKSLKYAETINFKDDNNNDFFIMIGGKVKAYFEKDIHLNEYENYFTLQRKNFESIPIEEEMEMEKILYEGDYFCKNIKFKGYILKKIEPIEDCHLIYLEEDIFKKIFSYNISKFEKLQRTFIIKTIYFLGQIPYNRYENFLNHIDTLICDHNEIIYCEGQPANRLYLIIKGSFELQVKEFNKTTQMNKINIGRERLKTVLKLEKGNLAGMEAFENPPITYAQTLKVTSSYGVIIAINPAEIANDALKKIELFIEKIKKEKEMIMKNIMFNNQKVSEKLKISYNSDETNKIVKTTSMTEFLNYQKEQNLKNRIRRESIMVMQTRRETVLLQKEMMENFLLKRKEEEENKFQKSGNLISKKLKIENNEYKENNLITVIEENRKTNRKSRNNNLNKLNPSENNRDKGDFNSFGKNSQFSTNNKTNYKIKISKLEELKGNSIKMADNFFELDKKRNNIKNIKMKNSETSLISSLSGSKQENRNKTNSNVTRSNFYTRNSKDKKRNREVSNEKLQFFNALSKINRNEETNSNSTISESDTELENKYKNIKFERKNTENEFFLWNKTEKNNNYSTKQLQEIDNFTKTYDEKNNEFDKNERVFESINKNTSNVYEKEISKEQESNYKISFGKTFNFTKINDNFTEGKTSVDFKIQPTQNYKFKENEEILTTKNSRRKTVKILNNENDNKISHYLNMLRKQNSFNPISLKKNSDLKFTQQGFKNKLSKKVSFIEISDKSIFFNEETNKKRREEEIFSPGFRGRRDPKSFTNKNNKMVTFDIKKIDSLTSIKNIKPDKNTKDKIIRALTEKSSSISNIKENLNLVTNFDFSKNDKSRNKNNLLTNSSWAQPFLEKSKTNNCNRKKPYNSGRFNLPLFSSMSKI